MVSIFCTLSSEIPVYVDCGWMNVVKEANKQNEVWQNLVTSTCLQSVMFDCSKYLIFINEYEVLTYVFKCVNKQ